MTKNNMQKLIIFQNHQQKFLIGAPKFFLARAPKFLNPALVIDSFELKLRLINLGAELDRYVSDNRDGVRGHSNNQ